MDVNSSFRSCSFSSTDFCNRVISGIDGGTYLDDMSFIDRFGYRLYSKFLSTTSKALICLDEFPEKVANFCEAGNDVGSFILEKTKGRRFIMKYVSEDNRWHSPASVGVEILRVSFNVILL